MSDKGNQVVGGNPSKEATELVASFKATFKSSMADDLHTPVVVSAFSDPLKFMNNLLHTRKVHLLLFFSHWKLILLNVYNLCSTVSNLTMYTAPVYRTYCESYILRQVLYEE